MLSNNVMMLTLFIFLFSMSVDIHHCAFFSTGLIGDEQAGVAKKYTYTAMPFYQADSPLLPSGLLGLVLILRSE